MAEKPRVRHTADGYVQVNDNLSNVVANLNTGNDKRSHNRFTHSLNNGNWAEFEAAYTGNWIARQIINVPVDDGLREWRSWQCKESAEIEKEEQRLSLTKHYKLARYWARLYGGGGIVMITDQPLDEPLDINKIKQGGLHRLVVMDRWDLVPQEANFTNPIAADYLLPEWYMVTGGRTLIHSSHIIRVDGDDLPRRIRAINQGWGDSALRKVMEDLRDVVAAKGGIASMILEANVDVIQRQGLSDELATGQEDNILKRYALAGQMKSIVNQLLLDGEEEYQRKQLTFGGLGDILDKFMVWISGAADIPMTRLFGRSAAGMNATGEGDLNNYYDSVASEQEATFRPELRPLDRVMIRSALGYIPDDCDYEWNPLYQESGTELAQQDLATAQAEESRLGQGILKRSHIMLRLQQEGRYAITDQEIDKVRADEEAEDNGEFDPDPFGNPDRNEREGEQDPQEGGEGDRAEQ